MMTKKKLPFKATALRNRDPAEPAPSAQLPPSKASPKKQDGADDGLDLFRQSKAMAPILAADMEMKMLKKKHKHKHIDLERRRAIAQGKRPSSASFDERDVLLDEEDDDGEGSSLARQPVDVRSPGGRISEEAEEQQQQQPDFLEDGFSAQRDRDSTPVTPPCKRARYGSAQASRSPKRQRPGQDTPLLPFRRTSARPSPHQTPLKPKRPAVPSGNPIISLLSDSEDDVQPPTAATSTAPRRETPRYDTPLSEDGGIEGHYLGDGVMEQEDAVVEVERPQENEREEEEQQQQQQQATEQAHGDEDEDEDDEFAEWIHRARQRQHQALASAGGGGSGSGSGTDSPGEPQAVTILVRSEIPGTKSLLVKYTYQKPLRVLRDSWVAAQVRGGVELPGGEDDVVITWCRRIVYPSSSLQTLDIRPLAAATGGGFEVGGGGSGGGTTGGGGGGTGDRARGGFTPDGLKVLIELWTGEGYAAMKREELERRRRDAGEASSDDDDDDPAHDPAEQVRLKVTLRAPGMQPTNLTVLQETTVRTLVDAFRKQRGIDPAKAVEVRLDGDVLQDDETMEALGVEDMDSLDVYVR
ncbi:hypothetical protein ESCO_000994 [Escovopsis weberi]|uniref:Ubiquitin-like domain-containing protein n=1 Tax=Escovopsis weberi TaxID=150374 RepID=A0A0M8N283_ESCWE|nr:hypothetical protein ESCO_000994 [Escovopsis weberi]